MNRTDDSMPGHDPQQADQDLVAALLASAPPPPVSSGFLARVNARIEEEARQGWLALADFRLWTLRLVPAAAAAILIAVLWPTKPVESSAPAAAQTAAVQTFTPSSASDWQGEVSANALLEAALSGSGHVR
jgi:hypothetical protein